MNRLHRLILGFLGLLLLSLGLSNCTLNGLRPGGFTTVVVDAGHGGKDSGESPNQYLREKEVALDTARRLGSILKNNGLRVVYTRNGDYFVELDDRVAIANRYYPNDILVSIHYDASGSAAHGVHTFFWREDSHGLAVRVQRHLVGNTGMSNLGVVRRVLRLTHNPTVPSILCECGFLTNRTEASYVSNPATRQKIAQGIADGILEEQERGDTNVGVLPPIDRPVAPRPAYQHHTGSTHRAKMAQVRRDKRSKVKARATKSSKTTRSTKKTAKSSKRTTKRKKTSND